MNQYAFIWAPYSGKVGTKTLIGGLFTGTMQEAFDFAYKNQTAWRKQFGDGQVIITRVQSYLGLN